MMVIDGTNSVLGRLSTDVAKRLLRRKHVHIVNAEKVVVTGTKEGIMPKFRTRMEISPKGNPHKGPKYSRMPDKIVRRAIRGMLPWKTPTGRAAYKNLRVHISVPEELEGKPLEKVAAAENRREKGFMTVAEISRMLGAKWE